MRIDERRGYRSGIGTPTEKRRPFCGSVRNGVVDNDGERHCGTSAVGRVLGTSKGRGSSAINPGWNVGALQSRYVSLVGSAICKLPIWLGFDQGIQLHTKLGLDTPELCKIQ